MASDITLSTFLPDCASNESLNLSVYSSNDSLPLHSIKKSIIQSDGTKSGISLDPILEEQSQFETSCENDVSDVNCTNDLDAAELGRLQPQHLSQMDWKSVVREFGLKHDLLHDFASTSTDLKVMDEPHGNQSGIDKKRLQINDLEIAVSSTLASTASIISSFQDRSNDNSERPTSPLDTPSHLPTSASEANAMNIPLSLSSNGTTMSDSCESPGEFFEDARTTDLLSLSESDLRSKLELARLKEYESVRLKRIRSLEDLKMSKWSRMSSTASESGDTEKEFSTRDAGLTGLQNMGNTCYQNTVLQCLSKTIPLIDYILSGKYIHDINTNNPLGSNGTFAFAFANVMQKIYSGALYDSAPNFKATVDKISSSFEGFDQHDVLDFLEFCLDNLHEDLNQISKRPYKEMPDYDEKIEDTVQAALHWEYFKLRECSIIIDQFQGQYKSALTCLECGKVSKTFDPFRVLSVPLPEELFDVEFTLISMKGKITRHIARVSQNTTVLNLKQLIAGRIPCEYTVESLEVLTQDDHRSLTLFEESQSLTELASLTDLDIIVFEKVPNLHYIVVNHWILLDNEYRRMGYTTLLSIPKNRVEKISHLYRHAWRRLRPFISFKDPRISNTSEQVFHIFELNHPHLDFPSRDLGPIDVEEYWQNPDETRQKDWDESLDLKKEYNILWKTKFVDAMDEEVAHLLCGRAVKGEPFIISSHPLTSEGVQLTNCLELFANEETLEEDEAWYCPQCNCHQKAKKQLSVTRLPEILIVNLKRFACEKGYFGMQFRKKLMTPVGYPIEGLDMSKYVENSQDKEGCIFDLFAVANHWGHMSGGHYTAYCKFESPSSGESNWFEFDDWNVTPLDVSQFVTAGAYLLFYRRRNSNFKFELTKRPKVLEFGPSVATLVDDDEEVTKLTGAKSMERLDEKKEKQREKEKIGPTTAELEYVKNLEGVIGKHEIDTLLENLGRVLKTDAHNMAKEA